MVHWCERRPVAAGPMAVAIITTWAGITVALMVIEETRAERADFDAGPTIPGRAMNSSSCAALNAAPAVSRRPELIPS